ncbi:hypothetical protein ACWC9T_06865 [Kitasatospora sp. NPDC001159]
MTVRSRRSHGRGQVPPPERTSYRAVYSVRGEAGVRRAEVTLLPGYSQESDIPRILAARLTGRPADAELITVLELHPV